MTDYTRRTILSATGATLAGFLAGCGETDDDNTESAESGDSGSTNGYYPPKSELDLDPIEIMPEDKVWEEMGIDKFDYAYGRADGMTGYAVEVNVFDTAGEAKEHMEIIKEKIDHMPASEMGVDLGPQTDVIYSEESTFSILDMLDENMHIRAAATKSVAGSYTYHPEGVGGFLGEYFTYVKEQVEDNE